MNIDSSTTLANLATTYPAASRVFQRIGLDYCCGGRTALSEACRARGLDTGAVVSAIEAEEAGSSLPRWDTAPIPDLIDFIITQYHEPLRAELPALIDLAAKVERRHAERPDVPRGLRAILDVLHERTLEHLMKEERVLFPMILEHIGAGVRGPVRVLEAEHEDHAHNLRRIRQLTHNFTPPADACTSWRALYLRLEAFEEDFHNHVHLENNVLFVRALEGWGK